jgi:hypothetical protein
LTLGRSGVPVVAAMGTMAIAVLDVDAQDASKVQAAGRRTEADRLFSRSLNVCTHIGPLGRLEELLARAATGRRRTRSSKERGLRRREDLSAGSSPRPWTWRRSTAKW